MLLKSWTNRTHYFVSHWTKNATDCPQNGLEMPSIVLTTRDSSLSRVAREFPQRCADGVFTLPVYMLLGLFWYSASLTL
jgi:hypothetical protein